MAKDDNPSQKVGSKPLNDLASSNTFLVTDRKCKICAKLPFHRKPGLASMHALNSRDCLDLDFGLFEVASRTSQPQEDFKIDQKLANRTAEAARRNIKSFQKHLQMNKLLKPNESESEKVVAVSIFEDLFRFDVLFDVCVLHNLHSQSRPRNTKLAV